MKDQDSVQITTAKKYKSKIFGKQKRLENTYCQAKTSLKKWAILKKEEEESTVYLKIDFSLISDRYKGDKNKEPDKESSKHNSDTDDFKKKLFLGISAKKNTL